MEVYAALAAGGLVAVQVNFRLKQPEIAHIVGHSEARAVIAQDKLAVRLQPVRPELPVPAHNYIAFGPSLPAG